MAEMLQNEVRESVLTEKDIKKAYMRWYNMWQPFRDI